MTYDLLIIMKIIKYIKSFVDSIIRICFLFRSLFVSKKRILFIPHSGMAVVDKYNIMNYRSDCALSFAHYILENNLLQDKLITITISDSDNIQELNNYISATYKRRVDFVYSFDSLNIVSLSSIKKRIQFYSAVSESSYVFLSNIFRFRPLSYNPQQTIVELGYYSCPFKNDIFAKNDQLYMRLDTISSKDCRYYVCCSELSIRLILPSMSLKYKRYINLGMCRNDHLISDENMNHIRTQIVNSVGYQVDKIVLYTPTHRDYEMAEMHKIGITRELLGFDVDLKRLDMILKSEKVLILCKLHPKQNRAAISKILPDSIVLHKANNTYGLTELMKISDALITDYTSGYFDYLLLDKPVLFNFYDIDIYKQTRGFTFDPIESICAGDIIYDEDSLIAAIRNIDRNALAYREKRHFLRNLVFTHQDTNSCERVYNYFFNS